MAKGRKTLRRRNTGSKPKVGDLITLNINFVVPPDFPIIYADQAVVQHYPDEFVISFFQSAHPILLRDAQVKDLTEVQANCVARFAITPQQMARLTGVMVDNFNKWKEKKKSLSATAEEDES